MTAKELLGEADGLLKRWSGVRLPNQAALAKAKGEIEKKGAANVAIDDPEALALCQEIEQTWLWESAINRGGSRKMTYVCVAVSIMIMFLVGSLYVFYNQGAALLAEMQTLAAKQPDRRFGQLERQLLIARADLFAHQDAPAAPPCPPGTDPCPGPATGKAIDELAQEASYALLHELRDLNFALSSLEARKNEFQKLAVSPVPGLGRIWNWASDLVTGSAPPTAYASDQEGVPRSIGDPNAPGVKSDVFTTNHFCAQRYAEAAQGTPGEAMKYPRILGMKMGDIVTQACDYSLGYTSMTVPSVNLWALQVKNIIAPYSAWILPALFACLGTMIYFLRLLVDPTQPSPSVNRVVHRMALAALAGVIAGWFWEPAFGTNSEFQAAGLGLFTFAFVVGFSIEIFFSLLDRFVEISSTAITKLGT